LGVCDDLPAYRTGLRTSFATAEFLVEEPEDPVEWAARPGDRALLLTVDREPSWEVLSSVCRARASLVVVALLADPSCRRYRDALALGARSAVARKAEPVHVVEVLRAAVRSEAVLPVEVVGALVAGGSGGSLASEVLDEEAVWLQELACGVDVDELAWRHGFSRRTMYRRLGALYRRMGVSRRTEALVRATQLGLLDRPVPARPATSTPRTTGSQGLTQAGRSAPSRR